MKKINAILRKDRRKATIDANLCYGVLGLTWFQRTKNSLPKVQGLALIPVPSGSSLVQNERDT